jgi:hypothetical protein
MLGGMWGFQNHLDRELANKLMNLIKDRNIAKSYNSDGKSQKGRDQDFLQSYFLNHAQKNSMTHASFHCNSFGGSNIQAFTVKRPNNYCFATCSLCCDAKYNESWPYECPVECRPKDHQDWKYC